MENQTNSSNNYPKPQQVTTTISQESSRKKLISLLKTLFLLTIGFVSGYFYRSKTEIKTPSQQTQIENSVNTSQVQTTIQEQNATSTANWKVYKDPEGNFSYKYPNDLFFKINQTQQMVFFYSNPDLIENKSDETEKALFYIQVSIYPKSSYKTLKEKQAQGDASVYELAEFKDSQGRLWVSNGPVWSQGDSSNYTVETNYKDKYYHINSQAYGKNLEKYLKKELIIQNGDSYDVTPLLEEHAKLIKNILSTFEFTN